MRNELDFILNLRDPYIYIALSMQIGMGDTVYQYDKTIISILLLLQQNLKSLAVFIFITFFIPVFFLMQKGRS